MVYSIAKKLTICYIFGMSKNAHINRLREIALNQHGMVTNKQALEAGVSGASLAMLHARGDVERVASGVYRVSFIERSPREELMLATLWAGFPEAALSHETALDLWDVCDVNPMQIDVCIGRGRRIRKQPIGGGLVHKEDLSPSDITVVDGIRTVRPNIAIQQCIKSGTQTRIVKQAIDNARSRGLITPLQEKELATLLEKRNHG